MKLLPRTLNVILLSASLLAACVSQDTGNDTANIEEGGATEELMQKRPQAPGEFAVFRSSADEWFFHLVGDRGDILVFSEAYVEKASALNGILSIKDNGVYLENYEVGETDEGLFYFVLRAQNGQVIAESANYASEDEAGLAIEQTRELVAKILKFEAAMTQGARFMLGRSDGQWFFELTAEDGRVLVYSELYTNRTGAVNGAESVRKNGKDPARFVMKDDDGFYFVIKAGNGQVVGESDTYETREDAEAARDAVIALLQSERVADPW
jgi:uncharacterized protein YegP (UPF0339 family)